MDIRMSKLITGVGHTYVQPYGYIGSLDIRMSNPCCQLGHTYVQPGQPGQPMGLQKFRKNILNATHDLEFLTVSVFPDSSITLDIRMSNLDICVSNLDICVSVPTMLVLIKFSNKINSLPFYSYKLELCVSDHHPMKMWQTIFLLL